MTIPSFPWFAEVPNQEFGTSGFLENAARAAGLPVNSRGWWGAELIGRSSFQPPATLCVKINSPVHGGRGPLENPGYFNGNTRLGVAPVSRNWVSVGTYSFTANYDLGLRGRNVTDSQLKALGFDPKQYMILDTSASDPQPLPSHRMKGPVVVYFQGHIDYHCDVGYFVGTVSNPFASHVVMHSFKDKAGGRHWWCRSYPVPTPTADQIITPCWWTDRGGDRIQFTLVPYNAGYSEWHIDSFEYRYGNGGSPTSHPHGFVCKRNYFRHPDGPLATYAGTALSLGRDDLTLTLARPCAAASIPVYAINEPAAKNANGNPFYRYTLTAVPSSLGPGGYTSYKCIDLRWSSSDLLDDRGTYATNGYRIRVFDALSAQTILHPEIAAADYWWN